MLLFLKLGGSLITDKQAPQTARPQVLARLMDEIVAARAARPELRLLLGHGSGSFGHEEARKYDTRQGVHTAEAWRGFAEVQAAAGRLNRLVVDAARAAGLPVVNLPPSASTVCRAGAIKLLAAEPVRLALARDLVPLVFGDVAFDEVRGGTIVSTEDVFAFLAMVLRPAEILLAGIEPGVLTRWPDGDVVPVLPARDVPGRPAAELSGSHAADVTGGMAGKAAEMLALAGRLPGLSIRIFSGMAPGLVQAALLGQAQPGTQISGV